MWPILIGELRHLQRNTRHFCTWPITERIRIVVRARTCVLFGSRPCVRRWVYQKLYLWRGIWCSPAIGCQAWDDPAVVRNRGKGFKKKKKFKSAKFRMGPVPCIMITDALQSTCSSHAPPSEYGYMSLLGQKLSVCIHIIKLYTHTNLNCACPFSARS